MARSRVWQYLILLLFSIALCLAASPTSFCKCTCFSNSTIIALDDSSKSSILDDDKPVKRRTCSDCNKQFCLDYNLPICKHAKEEDVFTQCFQRDSTKDQLVVFIFILVTASLLVWAAAKPWVEKWQMSRRPQQSYAPVLSDESNLR